MSEVTPRHGHKRWWALAALALAMLTIGLDTTVLNVAVPTLATALHASNDQLQWFSAVYTLVLAAALLPAGTLGDRFGRKKLLLGALAVFGVASALCAWAGSAGMLIGARAALGLGAAFMMPLSMAVLPTLFPEAEERGRAITVWVTSTALGLPLGPILGGWLLDHFWWGSVFLINVPLVVVGILAVALLVPETSAGGSRPIDTAGAVLSSAGLLALTYGFIEAGARGWGSAVTLGLIAGGVVLLAGFVFRQARTAYPLIDLNLFRDSGFSFGTSLAVLSSFALFGLMFTLPQYFQAVLRSDALGSGLRLLPMIGGLVVGTRLAGRVSGRSGRRGVLILGCALLALSIGAGAFTAVGTAYGISAIWITGVGVGLGLALPTSMAIATDALDPATAGSGSALLQALRQVGGTIGVAVLGTFLASTYRHHLDLTGIPAISADAAASSVSSGVKAAVKLDSVPLLDTVRSSFVHGMDVVLLVCAAICAGALALAWFYRERVGTAASTAGTAQSTDELVS
ncbi:drug resistance transporter, EmrB/QacA subfamily [Nakamurella panacisegetis]|uniref:Drug resistance transporter, EmrB/QacA subfamily n=1 Tax=Nakamurella panacisegetis TaxID=1090615 RepID=A0A1H0IN22_9ACTN|nr:DHA2 family efflux MFS transporter permease subunit [Nakamurella panacisegetis]SDO32793.1 drug resistance transporter, EmrB/QacA subfamily [Nakamurella panacisegetis]